MLKETETEETIVFFVTYLLLEAFQLGGRAPGYANDKHSSSPEPINFFGAQSSLGEHNFRFGGAQAVIWGGHGPEMPTRGAGSAV